MMTKIPDFESDEETAVWFDSHDTAVYMDNMEEVSPPNVVRTIFPTKPIDVRLRTDYIEAIQKVAEQRQVPYQMLVQRWLMEKLDQEVPALAVSLQ